MADKLAACTICDERHIYRQSTDWCFDCEQAICAECKEFHEIFKATRNHATMRIKDYQTLSPSISSVSRYCSDHEETYQMFCQTHDKLLCPQCIEEHFECKDVKPLSKIIKNVKTSEAFLEAEQCLVDIDENILKIEGKIKDKIIALNQQKEIILSEVSKVRQKINEHLDQIESVIRQDVSDIEHNAKKELETVLNVLKEKKGTHSLSKQQLANVKQHASDLQTFFALRQISSGNATNEAFLQSIIDNGYVDKLELELSVDENFRSILYNIKTFGSVRAKTIPSDPILIKQKEKQAQLVGVRATTIQDIKLKLIQTIITNISRMSGGDFLPDGKLVFCNYVMDKNLVVTNTEGKHLLEFPVNRVAFDVRCISDKTVAVTTGPNSPYGINIIDINSRKILKFIARANPCCGITSVKESLVYCVHGHGIEMMDVNGENIKTLVRCDLPWNAHIASYNDKLFYSNSFANTVTCCDMKGNTIWTFNDGTILLSPCGISVDNDGHVYVVSNACGSVVVLSADGQQSRQVLSKEDGLDDPRAIQYDRNLKQLLINNFSNTAFLFGVSS